MIELMRKSAFPFLLFALFCLFVLSRTAFVYSFSGIVAHAPSVVNESCFVLS